MRRMAQVARLGQLDGAASDWAAARGDSLGHLLADAVGDAPLAHRMVGARREGRAADLRLATDAADLASPLVTGLQHAARLVDGWERRGDGEHVRTDERRNMEDAKGGGDLVAGARTCYRIVNSCDRDHST